MAIEAVVTCTETERAIGKMAGFEDRLRALFPAIGVLHPEGGDSDISLAHVLQTAALVLGVVLAILRPQLASAQSGIAGVVRDTSGAILPGVTVEAA